MLPLALKHSITQKVRLIINSDTESQETSLQRYKDLVVGDTEQKIISEIEKIVRERQKKCEKDSIWVSVAELRDRIKARDFYHAIEYLEQSRIIDIYRTYDEKIKPKYANMIRLHSDFDMMYPTFLVKSTDTQLSGMQLILSKISESSHAVAVSEIARDISHSTLKSFCAKKLIEMYRQKLDTEIFSFPEIQIPKVITPTDEQKNAINKICNTIDRGNFTSYLLYGITGSGKTEVYMRSIQHAQTLGKSALMLVPEISLTPQTVDRFYHVFGKDIAVLHSNLNDRERYMQWKKVASGEIKIVIGARSAIFAPLSNLGVIIVDEEHESTYKQEHQPCYHGRDLAVMRGSIEKAVVILGSATPSLESWHNALIKKYQLLTLSERTGEAVLPKVNIVDMRAQDKESWFSDELKTAILERLNHHEQVILFHNRRGYANFLQCVQCGLIYKCPACDISLNYHKQAHQLICHYCGHKQEVSRKCSDCGSYHFIYGSPGTEQIENQVRVLFPNAKVLRMDSDTARSKKSFDSMYDSMRGKHIDILLGTQMITKGLDFHNVTLVGVLMAEVTLNMPDFRSVEKTFQLLTQVAGRSGRGNKKGEVIIQTRNPDHYALKCASEQDFLGFSHKELIARSDANYPPKFRLCRVLFTSAELDALREKLCSSVTLLLRLQQRFPSDEFYLLPFIEAPLPKIKNMYRYHFIIKSIKNQHIQSFLELFLREFECPQKIKMTIDVDPMSLM
jgi:primosomal protein N' (replication factor Y)